jgi:hypothetical protein
MTEIDIFGVPEYFSSHVGAIEDAGYGMVRLVRITRNGVQQAVCSNVASAESILRLCRDAEAVATKVLMAGSSIN